MLRSENKILIYLTALWLVMISALGIWWLYLLIQFGSHLPPETLNMLPSLAKIMKIVKWEGSTFIVLLVLVSGSIFFLYLQNVRKAYALQDFFASLTHELKSPLASIKLNAEVMEEVLKNNPEKLEIYLKRIIQDSTRLEEDLDNILQLSRVQRGGRLNLTEVNLQKYIELYTSKNYSDLEIKISHDLNHTHILVDEFALKLILRNLLDNTKKHSPLAKNIKIELSIKEDRLKMIYDDQGQNFSGDTKLLGSLFYKHQSPTGSGIGLYLIKKLLSGMKGDLIIHSKKNLIFELDFILGQESA